MEEPEAPKKSAKPTLADQHWRLTVMHKSSLALAEETIAAIAEGNRFRFDVLIGMDIDWDKQKEILLAAAAGGDLAIFKKVADVCPVDFSEDMEELANTAAENGHLKILNCLARTWGLDISSKKDGLLMKALESGQTGLAEYFYKAGGRVDMVEAGPTMTAVAMRGHLSTVAFFLDKIKVPADEGDSRAFIAAFTAGYLDVAQLLLDRGANVDADGSAALFSAVNNGEIEGVSFLLKNKANPSPYKYSHTALMNAADEGFEQIVRMLLEGGADYTARQHGVLKSAHRKGHGHVVALVVEWNKAALESAREKAAKEFTKTFGDKYSVSDLRRKKGPSGDTGLLLAARAGKFAELLAQAGGNLMPEDLFHPHHGVESVLSVLMHQRAVNSFFEAGLWSGRAAECMKAHASLPENMRRRVDVSTILAEEDARKLRASANQFRFKGPDEGPKPA